MGCFPLSHIFKITSSKINFQNQIQNILSDSIFKNTIASVKIVSLDNDEIMYENKPDLLLHPASNLKLLTSATVLQNFSKDFSIPTEFLLIQFQKWNCLQSLCKGFGDPSFTLSKLNLVVVQLKSLGVNRIDGNIFGDTSFFDQNNWGNGWMWDDEPYYYAAYSAPLTIEQNSIFVSVFPNDSIGKSPIVKINPTTSFVNIINQAITLNDSSKETISIKRNPFERSNTILISGIINSKTDSVSEHLSVVLPNNYFLHLFKETLSSNGILFDGDMLFKNVNPKSLKVVTHNEPIDSIVVRLNKTSDNLSAENLLRIMSAYKYSPPGNTQSGLWIVNETVSKLGLDTTTFLIVDGSGMSNYNLITTNHYIIFLKSIYVNQELFERMYASLPIAGVDGTLKNRMKKVKPKIIFAQKLARTAEFPL